MNKLKDVRLELEILLHPPLRRHRNIIQLLGCTWEEDMPGCAPMLVMELANLGSLNILFLRRYFKASFLKSLCADVTSGLATLHASGIAHGDIKLENILVAEDSRGSLTAKISDFGQALLESQEVQRRGTPVYNAPEVQAQQQNESSLNYSFYLLSHHLVKGDFFAYGLLAFEIFNPRQRYYDFPETESFRQALLEDPLGQRNRLEMATVFASAIDWHIPDLKDSCRAIFDQTLGSDPRKRLPNG